MQWGLKQSTIDQVSKVFSNYSELDQAILYGSRAKGDYKNGSDIDLTLKGEKLNLDIVWKIRNDIDDLPTPYTFDISFFDDISNKDLIEHINRVGVVFYQKGS